MNLKKAIEIADNLYMRGYKLTTKEQYTALKILIEAGKAIRDTRLPTSQSLPNWLPGETDS